MKRIVGASVPRKKLRDKAVALQYKNLDMLPTILASGTGQLARRIIQLAEEHNVRVEKDSVLAEMLAALSVGDTICPESFRLVAELICFLYQVDLDWRQKHSFLEPLLGNSQPSPHDSVGD